MGDFWQACEDNGVSDRSNAAQYFKIYVLQEYGPLHATRILRNWFAWHYLSQGKNSVGGPLWGQAADIAYQYAKGEIGDTLFIDSCFDLQHNNGSLFTKTHVIPRGFSKWLDARAESSDSSWFIKQAPQWILEAFGVEPTKTTESSSFTCSLITGTEGANLSKKPLPQFKENTNITPAKKEDAIVTFEWMYTHKPQSATSLLKLYSKNAADDNYGRLAKKATKGY